MESVIGDIREFVDTQPGSACRDYPGAEINMQITRYRGVTRNPTTLSLQHGTIWYAGPF